MASEINQLGHHLDSMSERNRLSRDFTLYSLVRVIRELVAAFSVYRTYVGDDGRDPSVARPGLHRGGGGGGQAPQPDRERLHLRLRPRRPARAEPRPPRSRRAGRPPSLRDALPADHRPGHGQGRRGHRVLRLQPARLAQRGRRRSRRASANRRPSSTTRTRRAWPAGRSPSSPPRPTTPSAARTCARASTCSPRCPPRGPPRSGAGAPSPAASRWRWTAAPRPTPTTSTCSTRPWSAPGPPWTPTSRSRR